MLKIYDNYQPLSHPLTRETGPLPVGPPWCKLPAERICLHCQKANDTIGIKFRTRNRSCINFEDVSPKSGLIYSKSVDNL